MLTDTVAIGRNGWVAVPMAARDMTASGDPMAGVINELNASSTG